MLDKGFSQIQISELLMLVEDTVSKWSKKFSKSRTIGEFRNFQYTAYEGRLNKEQIIIIKRYITENTDSILFSDAVHPQHNSTCHNLNLIERIWKFMRKKVINTKYFQKFTDFRNAILDFFDNINSHANELKKFIDLKMHIINPIYPKTTMA